MTAYRNHSDRESQTDSGRPEVSSKCRPRSSALLCLVMLAGWLISCQTSAAQTTTQNDQAPTNFASTVPAANHSTDDWASIMLDGEPVGFQKTTEAPVAGFPHLRKVFVRTDIQVQRLGSVIKLQTLLWTTQTTDGQLKAFDLQRIDASGNRMERSGSLSADGRRFELTEKIVATRSSRSIPVNGPVMSPVIERWLPAALQLQANTSTPLRGTFDVFFPENAATSRISASVQPYRQIYLPDGRKTTAARLTYTIAAKPSDPIRLLIDENLQLIRKEKRLLNRPLVVEPTTADQALLSVKKKSLDLDTRAMIPINQLRPAQNSDQPLKLNVTVSRGFLSPISTTRFQQILGTTSSSATLLISNPVYPNPTRTKISLSPVQPLAPTPLMPTDDSNLQRMARSATSGMQNPIAECHALEKHIDRVLAFSPFSTNTRAASEVARQKKGDCTEHAVLLATLMRIRGIPARIASGLILTNGRPGFTGHVWVEAKIQNEWYPFDSTCEFTPKQIRIKLADSGTDQGTQQSVLALFIPILDLVGRTEITAKY